jgi:hypothetical protein
VYDTVALFVGSFGTLYNEDKTISWKIGSTTYTAQNTASSLAGTGSGPGNCGSEVGFVLAGHLATSKTATTEITACFKTDTGPGTTGSFAADLATESGGNTSMVIATATLDGATSSIVYT